MAWRNLVISNPAKLSYKNNNMIIKQDMEYSIPIEDIVSLIVEERQVTITAHLMSKLTENNIMVYFCNRSHLPISLTIPINNHSRYLKVLNKQLSMSKPFKKRLWQQIIKEKILNQGKVLNLCNKKEFTKMYYYSSLVNSGDTNNYEGIAARLYFKALYGGKFNRFDIDTRNAGLNYGYSIIRGVIARAVTMYGFLPALGIQHHSELNQFNLVDDLIEPYRPVVDLWVYENLCSVDEFNQKHRIELCDLLNHNIVIDDKKHTIINAIEVTVKSLVSATNCDDYSRLLLPTLIKLEKHSYE